MCTCDHPTACVPASWTSEQSHLHPRTLRWARTCGLLLGATKGCPWRRPVVHPQGQAWRALLPELPEPPGREARKQDKGSAGNQFIIIRTDRRAASHTQTLPTQEGLQSWAPPRPPGSQEQCSWVRCGRGKAPHQEGEQAPAWARAGLCWPGHWDWGGSWGSCHLGNGAGPMPKSRSVSRARRL